MQIDRETIMKLACEAGFKWIEFAKLVAEHSASVEREACAKVVNDDRGLSDDDAIRLMRAIRARNNNA